ncbi:MAG: AAA family ATPase [Clostridia bacterium]|nr:AAA family ATPase [Clostridia bacterium]
MQEIRILGREKEVERLQQCLDTQEAQLVVVCGRRRIGKTFLINTFFNGRFDFKLTGVYREPRETQLRNFIAELNRQTRQHLPPPQDWIQAFEMLREYLSSLPREEKKIVFLDEMPWLDTVRSGFLSAFEFFWNDFGCALPNLVLILCGSATSWMQKRIAENKGGLFHRQTCTLYLQPFTLHEVEAFLHERNIDWSRYDIAQCYMILGGIPYYWTMMRQNLSPSENIDQLFFRKRAELWEEYDDLYQTLHTNSQQYQLVMETLSRKRGGMTRSELAKVSGIPDNSVLTEILEDLVASEFVRYAPFFGNKKKETRYQVSDYYTLFYYRFVKDQAGRDECYWTHAYDNPSRRAWLGLTFELLCKDHLFQIRKALGIGGVLAEDSTWFCRPDPEEPEDHGAQIDLLIDRRDHVINICEIKFSADTFEIDSEYAMNIRRKIDAFQKANKTKKTIQFTMITSYGVKRNKYSAMVNSEVILDDLFAQ